MKDFRVEWLMMVAELALGVVLSLSTGWSLVLSCILTMTVGAVLQWFYRRGGNDRADAEWLFECAYTLWRRGGLSIRMSIHWANKLKVQFGDGWTGRRAAEHQLSQWQN